jgi:Bacterial surface protein, Ig-like domain
MLFRFLATISFATYLLVANLALAAPGDVLGTLTINNTSGDGRVPTGYQGVVSHDGYIWVLDFWTDRIYRVYPETVLDTDGLTVLHNPGDSDFNLPIPDNLTGTPPCDTQATCLAGGGLTFAGNFFWNASPVTDDIIKLDPIDGDNLESENTLSGLTFPSPQGITFDGTHFWIIDWQSNTINKVLPEDGSVLDTIPGPSSLPAFDVDSSGLYARPYGIAWDGFALWVSEQEENRIYRVNPADGSIITFFDSPAGKNEVRDLAWDGEFLWHVDQGSGSDPALYKIDSGVTPFGIIGCIEKNGIGIQGDVLLSQNATADQSQTTDADGCFLFENFESGVPLAVNISESGNDEKPVLSLVGGDVTLLVGDTYSDPGVTATDAEDDNATLSNLVTAIPDIFNVPSLIDTSVASPAEGYTITYNVIDSAGNAADPITRTVYVLTVDVDAPVITLLGDNPLYVEQDSTFSDPGATALDTRDGDLSGSITFTGTVTTAIAGSYTIDYNVADTTGNSATTVTRTVIVQDTTAPVISLIGSSPLTLEKGDTYTEPGATATDNIDGNLSGSILISGSVSANLLGSYVLTYNVSDLSGNAASTVTRTVNVVDTTPPVITLLGGSSINQELQTAFSDPGFTATDTPSEDLSGSVVVSGSVDTSIAATYTLNYNLTDSSGNAATTQTRTVIVADTTPPTLTILGDNPLNLELGSTYAEQGASAIDLIDGTLSTSVVIGGDTVDGLTAGTYNVTYDIVDAAGNAAATQTRIVNVGDTTPPLVTLLGQAIVEQELGVAYVDAGATASDNIDGAVSVVVGGDTVNTNVAGAYTITYSASDSSGNTSAIVTRLVEVGDGTPPVITITGANPFNHEIGTVFVDPGATANDNIDGNISADITTQGTVNASVLGSYVISYNVQDSSGNAAITATRTVNVADTGAPTISLIGANPLYHELNTAFVDPYATASDAADGDVTASIVVTGSVNSSVAGTYTLTYNASDSQGNPAATVTRTVIVADITAPVITLNGATTVNHEQGTVYNDAGATASDNIDLDISSNIVVTGNVAINNAGTYVLNYNVTDSSGNAATTITRTVVVADTIAPVLTLLGSSSVNVEQGTSYTDAGAAASDSADGSLTSSIVVSGDTVDANTAGTYLIRYDVADAAGNSAPAVTRTVVVADTLAPTITLLGSSVINHEQGTPYTDAGATANDSFDGNLNPSITLTGAVDPNVAGTYVLSYDVSDSAGNAATTLTRTVTVVDTVAPTITRTGAATINHEQGIVYVDAGATASDLVDGNLSGSIVATNTVNSAVAGTYSVTYDVSDAAGNAAATVVRTVIVADNTLPTISLIGANPITVEQGTSFTDPGATANDNISGDITGSIVKTGSVNINTAGTYTLNYNVSDPAGNAAVTVTRDVIVSDTTIPVLTLNGAATVNVEQGTSYTDAGATANDNINGNITGNIVVTGAVNAAVAGTYILQYDVADNSGNSAVPVTRTVTVADTIAPTLTLIGGANINHEQADAYIDQGATASDIADGNITSNVTVTGSVNVNVPASYVLTYNVSDIAGNAASSITRTITVADTRAPTITLNGSSTVNHELGTSYTDAGATASDTVDGNVTADIVVSGSVNDAAPGTYILSYDVIDAAGNIATTVTRTVVVADSIAPTISLSGATSIDLVLGQIFVDPGYTASDNTDGNLDANVLVTGSIDINTEGTYVLSYNVNDAAGNAAATQTRTVNVVTPTVVSFEAETASIGGLHTVEADVANTGFTGTGYIQHSGEGHVEYTFDAFAIPYDLVVRYAWDTGDRPLEVILNGISLGIISFPATGSLATWGDTAAFALTPISGSNTLRLQTLDSSGANLDSLTLTPQ